MITERRAVPDAHFAARLLSDRQVLASRPAAETVEAKAGRQGR
jgi:hypothetical protein